MARPGFFVFVYPGLISPRPGMAADQREKIGLARGGGMAGPIFSSLSSLSTICPSPTPQYKIILTKYFGHGLSFTFIRPTSCPRSAGPVRAGGRPPGCQSVRQAINLANRTRPLFNILGSEATLGF